MKKLFGYLASMVYPFLIAVFIFVCYNGTSRYDEDVFYILVSGAIVLGIIAVVGIVGNIVILSIDAHKERIENRKKSDIENK